MEAIVEINDVLLEHLRCLLLVVKLVEDSRFLELQDLLLPVQADLFDQGWYNFVPGEVKLEELA